MQETYRRKFFRNTQTYFIDDRFKIVKSDTETQICSQETIGVSTPYYSYKYKVTFDLYEKVTIPRRFLWRKWYEEAWNYRFEVKEIESDSNFNIHPDWIPYVKELAKKELELQNHPS